MNRKNTDDLRQELSASNCINEYIRENEASFRNGGVADLLNELYEESRISKAELARRSMMSEVYLHQMFSGRRNPSRDKLLCFCLGLNASLEDAQRLLEQATYARLYPRNKRDAIISYGLLHKMMLTEVNEALFAENEKTLC